MDFLLSADHISSLSKTITATGRQQDIWFAPGREHRDTTYITMVDRDLTVVSFINSIFDDFGSGIVAPATGVLLHNRACGFVLEPGHPNAIAGQKRPMHTIIPAILTSDAEAVMSFGVTGGHFQPLGQMEVLANMIDYGMSTQEAIDHPRWAARGDAFEVESTVPDQVLAGLRERGHRPVKAANPLGTAQAIWIDRARGLFRGGADGRRDGIALGF
jgi:gamma-glutamyltranspeptidase/glutathione hydrolase